MVPENKKIPLKIQPGRVILYNSKIILRGRVRFPTDGEPG